MKGFSGLHMVKQFYEVTNRVFIFQVNSSLSFAEYSTFADVYIAKAESSILQVKYTFHTCTTIFNNT